MVVERRRLLRRLDALTPLTIVRGLSGTGKTTLVANWARARVVAGDEILWINAADSAETSNVPALIEEAISATGTQRVVVVIDDAHYLDDDTVAEHLCNLLTAHEGLHLVVCKRTVHPIKQCA